jgi:hypothetical protein
MSSYIIYGTAVCLLFAYVCASGWEGLDIWATAPSKPTGPNIYHK